MADCGGGYCREVMRRAVTTRPTLRMTVARAYRVKIDCEDIATVLVLSRKVVIVAAFESGWAISRYDAPVLACEDTSDGPCGKQDLHVRRV